MVRTLFVGNEINVLILSVIFAFSLFTYVNLDEVALVPVVLVDWRKKAMNKTRVITAVVMSVVLIPFIFLGGYFTYFMAAILSFIGSYELVKMHNDKCNLPKTLNLVVPFASLCLMLVVVLGKITNISNIIN